MVINGKPLRCNKQNIAMTRRKIYLLKTPYSTPLS
jgi:hypothetical protein